ncbi:lasso peptide biosynthesis B2 protein [Rossellomorea vietnamensis]|uniref:Microcin J25-processing protein McjB C-terminal domain-containing protein n=1 Tax=Rossellomorea vietnamensis TaxID=218284 RepID=A0A0P6WDI9_9BACI|nr:lasso peptide biosynthesis B2 protein [Rossellomorea vietnamensis]KPL58249.1 hypothetical protein AM506_17425 [Rossellomorea vietnamensis]
MNWERILRRISIFSLQNTHTKKLYVEAYLFLGLARFLKLIPFSKVVEYMELKPGIANLKGNQKDIIEIAQTIDIVSKYTFWESQCLVKALAAMKMLERRRVGSTLYLGTSKDQHGKLIAHAWLESKNIYVTGAEGKESFSVVGQFAKNVKGELNVKH